MKRLSIKLRVTLWFTLSMLLLVTIVAGLLIYTEKKLRIVTVQRELMEKVDEIEDSNSDEISKKVEESQGNIYLSLYNDNKIMTAGKLPAQFDESYPLIKDMVRKIKAGNQKWLVYDAKCKKEHGKTLWVRGVVVLHQEADPDGILLRLLIISLPFVVIAIALVGYVVINHAFRPFNEIIHTAEKIGEGGDLSQRIQLGEGKDEIFTLAKTFDHMFEKLEAYFENEKRFTAEASHELRTPTSVIIAQCEYALEHADSVEEAKEALIKIKQQALRMSALIGNLLMLARMDNGQYDKWNLERINASELLDVIIEQQKELAAKRKITITKDLEPDIFIRAEETMIMRVFMNLIENAIQYGNENGFIHITLSKRENDMECRIKDNGIGIAPDHLEKIWKRFYQVDPSRNHVQNNAGLGLSMVKWIVEVHKGKIRVDSELGKGTVFTVILPYEGNKKDNL